ncbi:hypothetical protein H6G54_07070 [Anabaena cylindrica FACHB-243]|uniref:Uncharacterized protein n=1 Tax=Anabaena cylindrica (strain ATCC 27899 / PCC 7122) TaxID=272123 RepID=K9ZC02_ANACC|nr:MULTISPECIES: hypothetical protein [Anabaena]AFZ56244.1 hypothetical protein Anacy_0653 [Anabaena cylindrica PCC 7122]MBD2417471.1 hypothetical protein [Anabaena cylindrica FACHB-243]MBY5285626.1 hypothetical protein [Anabaena sp. CCAP 1446/1C]MBY5310964.1 hypothetical protein [Anabaena sp. CCAP 1446/1C]MCM2407641.1 hypothetical protein [Anabaena sp. CCAP 1446/1C]
MDWFNSFEQFFRQLSEFQSIVFHNWTSTLSSMQNLNLSDPPETLEQSVKLQEDLVKNSLDFQEQVNRFSIDTQRKLWDSYFKMMRK